MRIYTGTRTDSGCVVTVEDEGQPPRPLDLRLDLGAHSPAGFEWGYEGSGPAQLALALCTDHLAHVSKLAPDDAREHADRYAFGVYQEFKRRKVARLPDAWRMTTDDIAAVLHTCRPTGVEEDEDDGAGPPDSDEVLGLSRHIQRP